MSLFNKEKITSWFKKIGINFDFANGNKINADYISTIQTCTKVLVENVTRLPVLVRDSKGQIVENHIISKLFNRSFISYINSDTGRKLIEKDRVLNGNGFAKILYDKKGKLSGLLPYNYESIVSIGLKNGNLYYTLDNSINPFTELNNTETVNSDYILHFKTAMQNGFLGISPLKSLQFESEIRQRASETISNFYKNNAMNPIVLSSEVKDLSQVKALKEWSDSFELDATGSANAGKVIKLPAGFRIDTLNYKLIDADIINTLKFTNAEIRSAFGVPSFLMSYDTTQNIENQTLEFKTFTLNSILASYRSEIENKLLTSSEIEQGYYIDFDYSILLEADLVTKATAYKELVTNGLISPNEAISKLGLGMPIKSVSGDLHYQQMQYIPIEERNSNNTIENLNK